MSTTHEMFDEEELDEFIEGKSFFPSAMGRLSPSYRIRN